MSDAIARTQRKVLLTPEHSQWWLLSPGVALYYDSVVMLRRDYDAALGAGGQSSYHEEAALRLEAILREGDAPVLEIVDGHSALARNYSRTGKESAASLLADAKAGLLDPVDLIQLTRASFEHWIGYNERKAGYLLPGEPLRDLLEREQIPSWKVRLLGIDEILNGPSEERLDRFVANEGALSSFQRLLASAWRCIDLVAAGEHIYDPMLVQYMPAIELLERQRTSEEFFDQPGGNMEVLFEAYRLRMSRYEERVPIDLNRTTIRKLVAEFRPLRNQLNRVDETLRTLDAGDPAAALEEAKREILPMMAAVRRIERIADYGFWGAGMFASLLGVLGAPDAVQKIKEAAGSLELVRRDVGRFAGAYATIVDSMVMQQRLRHAAPNQFSKRHFEQHYWDFATKIDGV